MTRLLDLTEMLRDASSTTNRRSSSIEWVYKMLAFT